ncbi:uncharacterized protein EDB91DRAFT_1077775 [Suillus paluster]|uniref:uncharacterized protein n=1 Tax=Suillus paluster TaxID=48578 RepID=UPI001B868DB7|nr:uncharacterized protein EDB91DRAFT_1077775 [Suillus paluster]KAG1752347.1 hypothetical protein EDB91DRAFT_1077775 [Suillus paluster]
MDSHEHPIDKAGQLQDERMKANWNFFITWDQWVPPKLWLTPPPQKDVIPKPFGHEIFDMCRSTEANELPTMEMPTATSSAGRHFWGQTFDMCWDTKVDLAPIMSVDVARPVAAAVGYKANFNMCWGDLPSGGGDDLHTGGTTAPVINSVNSGTDSLVELSESHSTGTQAYYKMGFGHGLPDTSPALRDGSPSVMFETTEDLLYQATLRLESINTLMRDEQGHTLAIDGVASARDIIDAHWDLILAYWDACNQLIETGKDVVRIQHLMNMQCQIDDPLHVLLLAMRKMGRGHSQFQ